MTFQVPPSLTNLVLFYYLAWTGTDVDMEVSESGAERDTPSLENAPSRKGLHGA